MANDIVKADSSADIKNGTVVVSVPVTGLRSNLTNNNSVSNKPTIAEIQAKYDTKFDDPRYYTGDTA